ncbi:MAG: DUF4012 domain-containing protein [Candidatus Magasanikbacteria bacterium]|nr:DUF4012 domain-containing protein [Candidatus Magasanikbacteria bacterium]
MHERKQHITMGVVATLVAFILIALGALSYARIEPIKALAWLPKLTPSFFKKAKEPSLIQHLLGFDGERTWLVLFLNNTEIRPGGGFIGTYALVQLKDGQLTNLFVEGADLLDARAPKQDSYLAPKPIQDYLKVDQWLFRDSNWSPDFAESSQWAIWLYRLENGLSADRIDGVIGVTATVLEELVQLTGPITADGVTLRVGSAVSDLEHEVEYGFLERDIAVRDRKNVMEDLARTLAHRLVALGPTHWKDILSTMQRLGREKHLMIYSVHPAIQALARAHEWTSEVEPFAGDGFMVIDANLGALKTDHAMARSYTYRVRPEGDGYRGILTIRYDHKGQLDWRTSRYRSYTRVYVPNDAVVTGVRGFVDPENPKNALSPDRGARPGMQVLGGYVRVSPGEHQEIVVEMTLSPRVLAAIKKGLYTFSVQKQIGVVDPQLTVDFDFGKKGEPGTASPYQETRVLKEDYALTVPTR